MVARDDGAWRWIAAATLAALALLPQGAMAQTAASVVAPAKPTEQRDWDRYPRPDQSSGIERDADDGPSPLLAVPRAVLLVPRVALELASVPLRGGILAYERYDVRNRLREAFFTDDGTFGAFPTAFLHSDYGASIGLQVVHKDLFGNEERLRGRARYGGRYRQDYELAVSRIRLGGRAEARVFGGYAQRPRERFFGIGNSDEVSAADVMAGIDPTQEDTAVATRFRDTRWEAGASARVRLVGDLYLDVRSQWERRRFAESDDLSGDASLVDIYDPNFVVGFVDVNHIWHSEVGLRYDSRRNPSRYASAAMPAAGWFMRAYAGVDHSIGDGRPAYLRYGGDLQLFVDVNRGTRVLSFRALAEQIDGDVEDVPFIFLPSLGGRELLRGYESNRFRDRAVTMASIEYKWQIVPRAAAAYAFTDVGRVQGSLLSPGVDEMRVGYGGGLQFHTLESLLMRAEVASSIDGGVFFNLAFDPVIDATVQEVSAE